MKTQIEEPKKTSFSGHGIWAVVLCFVLTYVLVRGGGYEFTIIPGNPQVTAAATEQLITDIRSGERFSEAFNHFCIEIIENEAS